MTELPPQESGRPPVAATPSRPLTCRETFLTWCRIALLSFGGPAGQIAVMHRILVDEKKWISEPRFLHALNFCMLLPGPEAQQLATYIGWLMHRTRGGLMAGLLFIAPGVVSLLALSILYAYGKDALPVAALFFGLKPAVLAIVAAALQRIASRVLRRPGLFVLAAGAFVAMVFFQAPFPLIVLASGILGAVGARFAPTWFAARLGHEPKNASGAGRGSVHPDQADDRHLLPAQPPAAFRSLRTLAVGLALWFGPLALIAVIFHTDSVYFREGLFFSKTAVVTFGGAYAVLAYVAQQAVQHYGWLKPGEMLDGLGMAETTPGPLIMVLQFVGFMGAFRDPGPLSPLAAGMLGSAVAVWVTFVPCFLWIFLGAPYVERLREHRGLASALAGISAAVVGVVANMSLWIGWHTLFREVELRAWAPWSVAWPGLNLSASLYWPNWHTFDLRAGGVALLALGLTFVAKRGTATTLAVSTLTGAAIYLMGAL